jgi:hypothetical protein
MPVLVGEYLWKADPEGVSLHVLKNKISSVILIPINFY